MTPTDQPPRRLTALLLLGILVLPVVFGWAVLRRGYGRSLRWTVLSYACVTTLIPFVGRLG